MYYQGIKRRAGLGYEDKFNLNYRRSGKFVCIPHTLTKLKHTRFLNQAHVSQRPAHAWFLIIASVRECLCLCVRVVGTGQASQAMA